MTIKELQDIIIENFTTEKGNIDISGLEFNTNVFMNNQRIKGGLNQDCQEIEGCLSQNCQTVKGDLWQSYQTIKGDVYQHEQEIEGVVYKEN
jgi:hypothetical protein